MEAETSGGRDLTDKFKKNDRVFAKMRFYPPWPAKILGRAEGTGGHEPYFVQFFGTYDTSKIKSEYIYEYNSENILKFGKPKRLCRWKEAMEEIEHNISILERAPVSMKKQSPATSVKPKGPSKKIRASTSKLDFPNRSTLSTKKVSNSSVLNQSERKFKPKRVREGFVPSQTPKTNIGSGRTLSADDFQVPPPNPFVFEKEEEEAPALVEEPSETWRQLVWGASALGSVGSTNSDHKGAAQLEPEMQEAPLMDFQASSDVVELNKESGKVELMISDVGTEDAVDVIRIVHEKVSSSGDIPPEEMPEQEKKSESEDDRPSSHNNLEEEEARSEHGPIMLKITFKDRRGEPYEFRIPKRTTISSEAEREEYQETLDSIFETIKDIENG